MKNKYLAIVLSQFLATTALHAEAGHGVTSNICPSEITMDQLKTINQHGSITIGGHVLSGVDRKHIMDVTPKSYHPSSFTALAHLRGTETTDGKLHCNYGYKTTFGNMGSKLSENVLGTPKEKLNEQYDHNFTLEFDLGAHTSHSNSPLDAKEPPELSTQHANASTPEEPAKMHPEEVTPSTPSTPTTHEETTASSPDEHPPVHADTHQSVANNKPTTIVITKEEMNKDLTLKDNLSILGLVDNPKISEFIVDRRYEFIKNDASDKKVTTSPVDMVKMKQAYEYVKEWFAKKRQGI
jgi:hypothetical protein